MRLPEDTHRVLDAIAADRRKNGADGRTGAGTIAREILEAWTADQTKVSA